MLKIHRLFIFVGVIFVVIIAFTVDGGNIKFQSGFSSWLKSFSKELKENNISNATINVFLNSVKENKQFMIDINSEAKSNPIDFAKNFLTDDILLQSQLFYTNNKKMLLDYDNTYKIDLSYVISIFAIGSEFGGNIGNYKLVDVLANLAYKSDNKEFYKKELIYFLKLVDNQYFDINVLGNIDCSFSYIGILPSTYYYYGVDGDKNGKIDLFASKEDILHTTFFLLQNLGIVYNEPWGEYVYTPFGSDLSKKQGLQNATTISSWLSMNLKYLNHQKGVDNSLTATLILSSDNSNGMLLYRNFNSLFKVNNVLPKALAIGLLSDKIKTYASLVDYKEKNVKPVEKITLKKESKDKIDDKPLSKKHQGSKYLK